MSTDCTWCFIPTPCVKYFRIFEVESYLVAVVKLEFKNLG